MKAVVYSRFGPPEVLRVAEVEAPSPGEHEVLVRVRAAAVTTTDCTARKGRPYYARLAFGAFRPKHAILGTEFSGEVEARGPGVTRFAVGDQVVAASGTAFGAHAEYVCLPEDGALAPKPANASFADAVAVCEGGLTALPFLRDVGQVRDGQHVLINGASGAVGTAAVQIARWLGAKVTGVCGPANLELVRSLGADEAIDYTREDFTATGRTYDVVFDAVGKSSFGRCKGSLAPAGVYLTTVPTLAIGLHALWTSKRGGKKARIAFTGLRPAREKANDLLVLTELVETGKMRATIDRLYPMERIADAHGYVDRGHKRGHVVMTLDPATAA